MDERKVTLITGHRSPVPVEGRMCELAPQNPVGSTVDLIDVAIWLTALVPETVQSIPMLLIRICFIVEILVVGDVWCPLIVGILEYVVRHRQDQSRMDRRPRHDGFQCRMHV